jgi:hypothetical protein
VFSLLIAQGLDAAKKFRQRKMIDTIKVAGPER